MFHSGMLLTDALANYEKSHDQKINRVTYISINISGLYYKSFRIVIYDRNDSTIVEPVL